MILLDTSAVYALAALDDGNHERAKQALSAIEEAEERLCLHTYVLVESFSLIHRRLGLEAARLVSGDLARLPTITVDRGLHDRAVARLGDPETSGVSLVDAVSFVVMEERGIETAFAFDRHFTRAGFGTRP